MTKIEVTLILDCSATPVKRVVPLQLVVDSARKRAFA